MNDLWHHWFAGSWTHVIALSLAHFLWQGVLIGLVVASLDRLLRKSSTSSRYVLHLVALTSLPVCFVLTMGIVDVPSPLPTPRQAVAVASEVVSNEPEFPPEEVSDLPATPPAGVHELSGNSTNQTTIAAESEESQVAVDSPSTLAGNNIVLENPDVARNEYALLPSLASIIVIAYLLGVAVFLIRLTLAVWGGQRLRSSSQPLVDSHLLNIVAEQARRVGLRIVPVVALCERVTVPTVVGVVRPMVLIPASIITGLTPDQFATIISHELAHIRRYDLLVTLLQRTIESFFFFHPVVWYLSRRISRHREVCCDDLVVSTGHGPMDYAGALLRMAELCVATEPTGAIAATATGADRSQFESRVTRLMTMTQRTQLRLTRVGAVLFGSLLIPLMTVPPLIVGLVQAEEAEDTDSVTGTLQVQMAVLTPGPKSEEDVNPGIWQVAVDWKVPIRSDGGPGNVISQVDGAILRIEWQAVRRHNGGLQFDSFNWSIDNPIDRRDGVSLGGIGGRQIAPQLSWFGDDFESLASMQLDTAGGKESDRTLVFRARSLSSNVLQKRLNIAELTESERQKSTLHDGDEARFQRQMNVLQMLRTNRKPTVDEVNGILERLLASYPQRAGEIHAQAAHVLAQSGIKMFAEDVCRHASTSLATVSDPVQRARLFLYLSNAQEVQGRLDDANYWALRGLLELQPMQLPQVAPELPGLGTYRELLAPNADAADSQLRTDLFQRLAESEQQARETARRTQQLVQFRDIYIQILRRLNKTPDEQERLQEILRRRIGLSLPLSQLLQATFETEDAELRSNDLSPVVTPERNSPAESGSRFQTAYDSDPSFGRASIKHTDQRGTIANWNRALQQDDLTREQQVFAWWRIGALAAYNFNAGQGETADNDLAAKAFRKVLSIGNDLISRETLNAATVYATLGGGTREDQASRMEFAKQWLETRTDAMVVQSAWLVNHNGYCIDGRLMPGGMNMQTEAEKAEYLTKELANARESVTARAAMAIAKEDRPMVPDVDVKGLADRLVAAAGSPRWKLHHVDKLPTVLADDSLGYRITLRRTWEEYLSLPQQKETPPDDMGPFTVKHEDWEFVLFPRERQDASRPSDASTPTARGSRLTQSSLAVLGLKILWKTASSPYHTQAVCMGEGQGFVWYSLGTLFGQETIREKLKLTGGDDRIDLLIAGMQIEDEGNITANSCQRLIEKFGDDALEPIETAIKNTQEPTALRKLIGSLAFIRTDAATKLLMRLHESDTEEVSKAADYALVQRPLRRAAMSAYLNMLMQHRHVDVACEGAVHFRWKEALPILIHLTSHPESLRELSWTIPARRELEGNAIEYKLIGAQQTILADRTDPNDVRDAWQTLTDSEDFEAVVLLGIELATYTAKGPQKRINDFGFRVLLTRPRDELVAYLKDIGKVMPAENAKQVQQLLRQLKQSEQLKRLQSHGILVTPGGIDGASHRYVVPSDFLGGYVIDDLLQYCVSFSPKSEIVFFGPVITDDQFRQFHLLLPESRVRRMAAVWLNIVSTVSDDESERRILRVSDLGSPAREIGLQVDDVIVGIGPFRWPKSDSRDAFNSAMLSQIPGQESKIVVDRDGKLLTFPVTWEESTAHRLLCGNGMPTTQRDAIQPAEPDVGEISSTDNIQALTGKWEATEASHHLLDSKLVEANQTGFVIAIDKQFGESYRKTSDTYENQYREFLEQKGHAAVASGTIKFDYGGESEMMIARKDGELYLWYGVVTGGNPRIFLRLGADKTSVDSLAVQWTSSCSDSPLDLDTDSAEVFYQRPNSTHTNQTEN